MKTQTLKPTRQFRGTVHNTGVYRVVIFFFYFFYFLNNLTTVFTKVFPTYKQR